MILSKNFITNWLVCQFWIKKYHILDISLLLVKYTKKFVPQFLGMHDVKYFPLPLMSRNMTSREFPGFAGQIFWHIGLKTMFYLYNKPELLYNLANKIQEDTLTCVIFACCLHIVIIRFIPYQLQLSSCRAACSEHQWCTLHVRRFG